MILEDDVCTTKQFYKKSSVNLLNQSEKLGTPFIYLGDCFRTDEKNILDLPKLKNGDNSLVSFPTECLHSYIIKPSFGMIIKGALNILFPLQVPSDNWLPDFLTDYTILYL